MNKKLLLTVTALVSSVILFAQSSESGGSGGTKFGVRAGVNFSRFGGDAEGFGTGTGLNVGADVSFPLSSSFMLQPEIAYSELGAKNDVAGTTVKTKLAYLTIPVLAKYGFGTSGFSVYVGPQLGIRLSAKAKGGGATTDLKDDFNTTDFSGVFGFEFVIPNVPVLLSARYQLGFSNILKDSDDVKWNNNTASILVGYRF